MFLCARRKAHIGSLVRQKKKQNALLTPLLVEGEAMAGAGRGTREEESGHPKATSLLGVPFLWLALGDSLAGMRK